MDPIDFFRLLYRRRAIVVGLVLLGVAAGYFSASTDDGPQDYVAVHTLVPNINSSGVAGQGDDEDSLLVLEQYELLVTVGDVPDRAAAELGPDVTGDELVRIIDVEANTEVGALTIAARGTDPEWIQDVANAMANALTATLGDQASTLYERNLTEASATVDQWRVQVTDLEVEVADLIAGGDDPSGLIAQRDAAGTQYELAIEALSQLTQRGAPEPPLRTLQTAEARIADDVGLQIPSSRAGRMALLGGLALALAVGAALFVDRMDTRVRSRKGVEADLDLPVLAEIPREPALTRHRYPAVSRIDPATPLVEAYRAVRTMLLFHWTTHPRPPGPDGRQSRVALIVSPGVGEGKTTTVAHLAALFAESGLSVLVVSADFRRPRVHELLEAENEPGLNEVISGKGGLGLGQIIRDTGIENVRLLPSGAPADNVTNLVQMSRRVVASARALVDVVLIDTAPLLVANDAAELIPVADAVVLVARGGRTSEQSVKRATQWLRRLDAPLVGTVLVGVDEGDGASHYRTHYYAGTPTPTGIRRFLPWGRRAREPRRHQVVDGRTNGRASDDSRSRWAAPDGRPVQREPANAPRR